ncbi:unnamed protein product [Cuscuta campestris]|uniref:Uncharacterized protein n=1 Tax=Cuscuta campestris TaxID=132261 RepID=A0A484KI62_9ASTE|nr:unnamed protein product [Cuscuta campestris]
MFEAKQEKNGRRYDMQPPTRPPTEFKQTAKWAPTEKVGTGGEFRLWRASRSPLACPLVDIPNVRDSKMAAAG